MTELTVILVSVIIFPIMVGWLRGRNNVEPYTTKGSSYYNSNME